MNDPYLYENSSVLRNLLNIRDEKELDLAEAELSRANMMLLYEQGFEDFSTGGVQKIHKALFGEGYDAFWRFSSDTAKILHLPLLFDCNVL